MAKGNQGKLLSFQTIDRIKKLRESGHTIQKIVEITNLSSATIVKYLKHDRHSNNQIKKLYKEINEMKKQILSLQQTILKYQNDLNTLKIKQKKTKKPTDEIKSLFK